LTDGIRLWNPDGSYEKKDTALSEDRTIMNDSRADTAGYGTAERKSSLIVPEETVSGYNKHVGKCKIED
jgi:hypothetical protein